MHIFPFKENVKLTGDERSEQKEFINALWEKSKHDATCHNLDGSSSSNGTRSRLNDNQSKKCPNFDQLFDHYGEPIIG